MKTEDRPGEPVGEKTMTHCVTDSGRQEVYATGNSYEQAIRALDAFYTPGDFGCEDWDAVVEAWGNSSDGLGDLLCVKADDLDV